MSACDDGTLTEEPDELLADIEDAVAEDTDERSARALEPHVRRVAGARDTSGVDGATQLADARRVRERGARRMCWLRDLTAEPLQTDVQDGVPGCARIWVKTFGCAHNTSDSEYMAGASCLWPCSHCLQLVLTCIRRAAAGQLQAYGYTLVEDGEAADLWVINTCTVKSPSQSAMDTLLRAGRASGKALLVAGCVPQGDRNAASLAGLSLLGVAQLDRVVEACTETLKGNTVRLLAKKALPSLDLPKVRRNAHVEIVPLSTGCLGRCAAQRANVHFCYSPQRCTLMPDA